MSRIITDNYIDKLNEIIADFDITPNLYILMDFFIKELSNSKNKQYRIFYEGDTDLERINQIKESEKIRRLFSYINTIINEFKNQYLHIHINVELSGKTISNLLSLFVWQALVEASYDEEILLKEVNNIKEKIKPNLILPSHGQIIINQRYKERYGLKHRLKFIDTILSLPKQTAKYGLLLNLNRTARNCINLSDFSVFPECLNTFVNYGENHRNVFKEMGREKVERLSMVLNLFPSITGKGIWYKDFIRDEIKKYNNFKKVITISSGEKTSEQLLEMQKQNKFQAEEIYTIFSFEL